MLVVAILLSVTGYLNITLNEASAQATHASSILLRLDSRLHQEGTLQWRALAERGMPTRVAADVGLARAEESALITELETLLPASELARLQALVADYHAALDEELSLLAVGRTPDAVAFEAETTAPLFASLSAWLRQRSDEASSTARTRGNQAGLLLVAALMLAATVIALLSWRADRAHRLNLSIGADLLDRERERAEGLRRSEAEVRHQAEHDPLTGLPNRLLFDRRLRETAVRDRLAVLFIDMDGFKAINDRYGHAAGDELLVAVGERLRRCARGSDTVARLGGDEFAILLDGADDDLAAGVAERITARLAEPIQLAAATVAVGASVGVAIGGIGSDPDQLLTEADRQMYEVKRRGQRVAARS